MSDSDQEPGPSVAAVLADASAAAGRPLSEPVALTGSARSVVLRCTDDKGRTVVVKSYPADGDGPASFAAEAAGLTVARDTGLAAALLAADAASRTVVMGDLGSGPSMADVLLGSSAAYARETLVAWARYCGELSAEARDRQPEFSRLLADYLAGRPEESYATGLRARIVQLATVADRLAAGDQAELGDFAALAGFPAPAGLAAELAMVADAVSPDRYPVFSPGDICPDNNLITGGRLRFVDFENAGFHCAFLNAAYIRMPFSTCWCVFRLPEDVAHAAEVAYRSQVCRVWPALADDGIWQPGVRFAVAAWTLSSMTWLLPWALRTDVPTDTERVSPRNRQLMRHRWEVLAGELQAAGSCPALADFTRSLLAATEYWQAAELPLYPAFR